VVKEESEKLRVALSVPTEALSMYASLEMPFHANRTSGKLAAL